MKNMISLTCPQCNATVSVEEDREMLFCSYCGHKILLNDENKHTFHYVDEADIKRAETEQLIQLKEMELEEKNQKSKKIAAIVCFVVAAVLGVYGLLGIDSMNLSSSFSFMIALIAGSMGFVFLTEKDSKKRVRRTLDDSEVQISSSMRYYQDKHYQIIEGMYKSAGFTNISVIPLHDLGLLEFKKVGLVEKITISDDEFSNGDIFKKTDPVVISYHSRR